ncbi:hypothetical protein FRB95_000328 [Tulasnella sp. JGI-2019a]|nr:hypothetical protein FRB95_000328 [Tulasnella sp. JGI-2019a]
MIHPYSPAEEIDRSRIDSTPLHSSPSGILVVSTQEPATGPSHSDHVNPYYIFDGDLCDLEDGEGLIETIDDQYVIVPFAKVNSRFKIKQKRMRKPQANSWTREEDRCLVHFVLSTGISSRRWSDITAMAVAEGTTLEGLPSEAIFEKRWNDLFASLIEARPNRYIYGEGDDQLISVVIAICLSENLTLFKRYTASKKHARDRTAHAARFRWKSLKEGGLVQLMGHADGDEPLNTEDEGWGNPERADLDVKMEIVARGANQTQIPDECKIKLESKDIKPELSRRSNGAWTAAEANAALGAVLDTVDINWDAVHATLVKTPGLDFGRTQAVLRRNGATSRTERRLDADSGFSEESQSADVLHSWP